MYNIMAEEKTHFLLITTSGNYEVNKMKEGIKHLVDWSGRTRKTRILIDTLDLELPKSEFDKFILGETFAALAKPPLKIAILSRPEMITKFLEDTAVNRGSFVFVSSDRQEVLDWLLDQKS